MHAQAICDEIRKHQLIGTRLESLLATAVERVHALSPSFDWTGIYELFPDEVLRLGPFIGAPTDHVFIAVGRGVCGTAVSEKRNLNIPDVTKVENYLACSTETRSELVVLIRDGDRIFGQIDIDSHQIDPFTPDLVHQVEMVADQLARAYLAPGLTPPRG